MVTIQLTDLRVASVNVRTSNAGKEYASVNASFWTGKDQNGNNQYQNVAVLVFGFDVGKVKELTKGQLVNVTGTVTGTHTYNANDGRLVVVLDVKADRVEKPFGSNTQGQQATQQKQQSPVQNPYGRTAQEQQDFDNDLPF
ncbi:MAG: hypothetical protein HUK19_08285 [Fibrobacter sp.]|nr:hypothetical protein [Fibrobacter sp.]